MAGRVGSPPRKFPEGDGGGKTDREQPRRGEGRRAPEQGGPRGRGGRRARGAQTRLRAGQPCRRLCSLTPHVRGGGGDGACDLPPATFPSRHPRKCLIHLSGSASSTFQADVVMTFVLTNQIIQMSPDYLTLVL